MFIFRKNKKKKEVNDIPPILSPIKVETTSLTRDLAFLTGDASPTHPTHRSRPDRIELPENPSHAGGFRGHTDSRQYGQIRGNNAGSSASTNPTLGDEVSTRESAMNRPRGIGRSRELQVQSEQKREDPKLDDNEPNWNFDHQANRTFSGERQGSSRDQQPAATRTPAPGFRIFRSNVNQDLSTSTEGAENDSNDPFWLEAVAEDIERRPADTSNKGKGKEVEVGPFGMKPIDAAGQKHRDRALKFLLGTATPPSELDTMPASLPPGIYDVYGIREFVTREELEAETCARGQEQHEHNREALDTQNKTENADRLQQSQIEPNQQTGLSQRLRPKRSRKDSRPDRPGELSTEHVYPYMDHCYPREAIPGLQQIGLHNASISSHSAAHPEPGPAINRKASGNNTIATMPSAMQDQDHHGRPLPARPSAGSHSVKGQRSMAWSHRTFRPQHQQGPQPPSRSHAEFELSQRNMSAGAYQAHVDMQPQERRAPSGSYGQPISRRRMSVASHNQGLMNMPAEEGNAPFRRHEGRRVPHRNPRQRTQATMDVPPSPMTPQSANEEARVELRQSGRNPLVYSPFYTPDSTPPVPRMPPLPPNHGRQDPQASFGPPSTKYQETAEKLTAGEALVEFLGDQRKPEHASDPNEMSFLRASASQRRLLMDSDSDDEEESRAVSPMMNYQDTHIRRRYDTIEQGRVKTKEELAAEMKARYGGGQ